jgi:voltage-gated potassium channel
MKTSSRFYTLFFILIFLLIVDVSGYIIIEKVNFFDALFMTIISVTTVGYKEVFPLSSQGKLFTIFVIFSGLGIFLYSARLIAENTVEGKIRKILGRRKMKTLLKMKNHIIIVGYGRMGEIVSKELNEKKVKFIIIEKNQNRFATAEAEGYNIILADATNEETLKRVSVEKAKTFISLLSSDADNIFTVLTTRELNPSIFIISRALDIANEKKLYKIGANRVVAPNLLASTRIVNTVLKPNVVNLIDIVTQSQNLSLSLEEITISEESYLVGKAIKESGLREKYNAIVIAVKRNDKMYFNPPPNLKFSSKDILIMIGEKDKLLKIT